MIMNLKRIWKEAIVAYFKILLQNLLGGLKKEKRGLGQITLLAENETYFFPNKKQEF
jgi:hypothetical protein